MPSLVALTPSQQRVWLTERHHPGTHLNHIVGCYHLDGELDPALLSDALRMVSARHELLRASFTEIDGRPVAQIHGDATPSVIEAAADDFARATSYVVETAKKPFDPAIPGLVRLVLCSYGPERRLLTVVTHHLVADGAGASVLVRDLAEAYSALRSGVPWAPPALVVSYSQHATAEAAAAGGESALAGLDYWRRELMGAPPTLDLPLDFARPARRTDRTYVHAEILAGAELTRLRRFARDCRASPTMVLAGAWMVMLSRLSGQHDLVTGLAVSRRERPETEQLVASLMNVLPLRLRLAPGDTFSQVVRQVRGKLLEGLRYQDVPLQRIVDHLALERVPGLKPLVNTLFNQDAVGGTVQFDGVEAVAVPLDVPAGMDLDMELSAVNADNGGMRLVVHCAADLFSAQTTAWQMARFTHLLGRALTDPESPVDALELISPQERAVISRLSAGPEALDHTSARGPIERRMREVPSAVAVIDGGRTITYGHLAQWVSRITAELRAAGVGAGDQVALYVPRSAGLLAGMLATWRLGAAYVPVDPDLPVHRVSYLLSDSAAAATLTTGALRSCLPDEVLTPLVIVDDEHLAPAAPSDLREPAEVACPDVSHSLAYVAYTSGSSGRPKGVRVSHRGLANLLAAMVAELGIGADTVMLALTTPSFDIAALELFAPLWVGGRIVIAPLGSELDPPRLADLIHAEAVTCVQATPVTWERLAEALPEQPRLHQAICGGEALSAGLARRICRVAEAVWNGYGPTETTVYSICHRVDPAAGESMTPIGLPIAGTTAHVVDAQFGRQPLGMTGELLLGGPGVARGYHGRPELSAERFISDPFGEGTVYRTGDMVRLRYDGVFEFRGRLDNQVKLRGHRIELDEIAHVLRGHPEVADAVVAMRPDGGGEHRLVAYVVWSSGGHTPDRKEPIHE